MDGGAEKHFVNHPDELSIPITSLRDSINIISRCSGSLNSITEMDLCQENEVGAPWR